MAQPQTTPKPSELPACCRGWLAEQAHRQAVDTARRRAATLSLRTVPDKPRPVTRYELRG
jgi:hypothetical protein